MRILPVLSSTTSRSTTSLIYGLLLASAASTSVSATATEYDDLPTSQLVSRGDLLLASQHVQQALEMYDLAVARDPSIYLNLYKRGTTHLALKHTQKALADFNAVLALTDFDQAQLQIARIHLKEGSYSLSSAAVSTYLKRNKKDQVALDLKAGVAATEKAHKKALAAQAKKDWESCTAAASTAIEKADFATGLLELRANCQSQAGRIEEAIGDLTRAVSISPSSPSLLTRLSLLSTLYLHDAPASSSLVPLKQCLHFDPDSRTCKPLFRLLKKLDKDLSQARNFIEGELWRKALNLLDPKASLASDEGGKEGLVQRVRGIIDQHAEAEGLPKHTYSRLLTELYGWTCKAYIGTGSVRSAKTSCEAVHARDPDNIDGLVGVGESLLKDEKFEEAVRLLSAAFEKSGQSDRKILERVQRAQKLLKQSKVKDYYKVLGVARDADQKTIKRAYRKATLVSHPDKEGGSEDKMAAVNQAYEVLGNEELRARYDNGDDPNDPMSGQHGHPGGGGNPFFQHGGGGNPFFGSGGGGGGNQFFQQFFQNSGGQQGGHRHQQQHMKFQWG